MKEYIFLGARSIFKKKKKCFYKSQTAGVAGPDKVAFECSCCCIMPKLLQEGRWSMCQQQMLLQSYIYI